jgi:hypothetical protein
MLHTASDVDRSSEIIKATERKHRKERDSSGDLDVDGRTILKWVLKV